MDETTLWIERKDSDCIKSQYVQINSETGADCDEILASPVFRETTV